MNRIEQDRGSLCIAFRVVPILLIATITLAAGPHTPERPDVLIIEPRITLEPVTVAELLPGGGAAIAMGRWTGRESLFPSSTIRTRIVRRLPALWRIRIGSEKADLPLDVRYELTAPDGRADRLTTVDGFGSEIRTELRAVPPLLVSHDGDGTVFEGGLLLYMDLSSLLRAGRYSGMLTVTLDHL